MRAQSIIMCLRNECQLHRLNANCFDLLAISVTKVNHTLYATSFLRFMLRSGYLPHVKPWIVIVNHLTSCPDHEHGPLSLPTKELAYVGEVKRKLGAQGIVSLCLIYSSN
ncbi:hypothetical protein JHK86_004622 [Glycine max]|nr:hypothetical protein JHK86_004622 [Glycine max]